MISHGILLLARQIFVGKFAVGIAGAANVDAAIGDAVAGKPGMHVHVARDRAVAAAIGNHLDDDRHLRVGHRTPERGGYPRAVRQHDPERIDGFDLEGEFGSHHGGNVPETPC